MEIDADETARVGLVSYGISSRSVDGALRQLRAAGEPVSHLRLVTVFPFPEKAIQDFAAPLERIIVPELNLGQICHTVREAVDGQAAIERVSKIGGEILTPEEIVVAVREGGEQV